MSEYDDKLELLKKYYLKIQTNYGFHLEEDMSWKYTKKVIDIFSPGLDYKEILGFYDITLTGNGRRGYLFTNTKAVFLDEKKKPVKIWYDEIESIELLNTFKKDNERTLRFNMKDGENHTWSNIALNKTPLYNFFRDLINMVNQPSCKPGSILTNSDSQNFGAMAGGLGAAGYRQVNKSYDEEKFHGAQGHGYAAERANTLFDIFKGHNAYIVGDDNAKNGADRIVDGIYIQSKYCQTGSKCISECFENGKFRYMINGKPMQIEVPSDKYSDAIISMRKRILNGEIPGISDPADAEKLVRKGNFTYQQAVNLAKAGTVESLTYDSVKGIVTASTALGVTAVITFATSIWNGEDFDTSLKIATCEGLKVGGVAFITSVLAGQLSKAGLNSALVNSSEQIISLMGPKASAVLANAFRNTGKDIFGAAAMKSAAKILRGNMITAGLTVAVLTTFDVARIFQGKISGKQLFKNLINTGATVGGGTAGWIAGSLVGSTILPGAGTIVGGIIGSVMGGGAAGKISDSITDNFIEDDAEEMVRIIQQEFTKLAEIYLLNQKEGEKAVDELSTILDGKKLMDMFSSNNREKYARDMLVPLIEKQVSKRQYISSISMDKVFFTMKDILEEMADTAVIANA